MGEHVRSAAAGVRSALTLALRRRAPLTSQTTMTRSFVGVPWRVAGAAPALGNVDRASCYWGSEQPRGLWLFPESSPWSSGIGGFAARGCASSSAHVSRSGGGDGGRGGDSGIDPPTSTSAAARAGESEQGAGLQAESESAPASALASASASSSRREVSDDSDDSASKPNPRKDLYMMFTCGRCDTRAAKGFSRQAYENGVVIVRCPGCQSQHLVADRYGWFGEPGSCLLYTSPSPRDATLSRMPSSA